MIAIQVALGIILAVIVLKYWRVLLSLGVLGIIIMACGIVLTISGAYIYEHPAIIKKIAIFLLALIPLALLSALLSAGEERLSKKTLVKWNLTVGEIFQILIIGIICVSSVAILAMAIFQKEYANIQGPIGLFLLFVALLGGFITRKEIKVKQQQRNVALSQNERSLTN